MPEGVHLMRWLHGRIGKMLFLDVTISGLGLGVLALICPLMMVLMMVGMATMGGGHGHGMCLPWSHGKHDERRDRRDGAPE